MNQDRIPDTAAPILDCPGEGNGCRCACHGCKFHCSAHDPTRLWDEPTTTAAQRYPWRVRCSGCGWVDHFDTETTAQEWADRHNTRTTSWPHDAKAGPRD